MRRKRETMNTAPIFSYLWKQKKLYIAKKFTIFLKSLSSYFSLSHLNSFSFLKYCYLVRFI